jgi:signal peptidase I
MLTVTALLFGACVVAGDSMRPALQRGDIVVFRRGSRGVGLGSMVVLGGPGHEYVHRVIAISLPGRIMTKGDANPIADREPTGTVSVRGRVVITVPTGALARRLAASGRRARLWSQSHTER